MCTEIRNIGAFFGDPIRYSLAAYTPCFTFSMNFCDSDLLALMFMLMRINIKSLACLQHYTVVRVEQRYCVRNEKMSNNRISCSRYC